MNASAKVISQNSGERKFSPSTRSNRTTTLLTKGESCFFFFEKIQFSIIEIYWLKVNSLFEWQPISIEYPLVKLTSSPYLQTKDSFWSIHVFYGGNWVSCFKWEMQAKPILTKQPTLFDKMAPPNNTRILWDFLLCLFLSHASRIFSHRFDKLDNSRTKAKGRWELLGKKRLLCWCFCVCSVVESALVIHEFIWKCHKLRFGNCVTKAVSLLFLAFASILHRQKIPRTSYHCVQQEPFGSFEGHVWGGEVNWKWECVSTMYRVCT